jgi:hypothetical protein
MTIMFHAEHHEVGQAERAWEAHDAKVSVQIPQHH